MRSARLCANPVLGTVAVALGGAAGRADIVKLSTCVRCACITSPGSAGRCRRRRDRRERTGPFPRRQSPIARNLRFPSTTSGLPSGLREKSGTPSYLQRLMGSSTYGAPDVVRARPCWNVPRAASASARRVRLSAGAAGSGSATPAASATIGAAQVAVTRAPMPLQRSSQLTSLWTHERDANVAVDAIGDPAGSSPARSAGH